MSAAAGSGSTLLEQAREIFDSQGPLCDSEGFYQHLGDCFFDAMLMIFLYADGFKEYTQKFILDFNGTDAELDKLFPEDSNEDKRYALEFLTYVQNRFIRHYVSEYLRKQDFERRAEISKNPLYRSQGKNIQKIVCAVKKAPYEPGGTLKHVMPIISYFSPAFSGKKIDFHIYSILGSFKETSIRRISISDTNNDKTLYPLDTYNGLLLRTEASARKDGHALAFLDCGHHQYFYEDITGLVEYPWKSFIHYISNEYPEKSIKTNIYMNGRLICIEKATGTKKKQSYYPIIEKQSATSSTFLTLFDKHDGPVLCEPGKTIQVETETHIFKLMIPKLTGDTVEDNLLIGIYGFRIEGGDAVSPKENKLLLGSRIPGQYSLKQLLRDKNVDSFLEQATNEALIRENISYGRFEHGSPEHEAILQAKQDFFLGGRIPAAQVKIAIELDYPNLLSELYQKYPELDTDTIITRRLRVDRVESAISNNSPKVLEMICKKGPINQEDYDLATMTGKNNNGKPILTGILKNSSPKIRQVFFNFCKVKRTSLTGPAAAGAEGGYKKTRSRRRSQRRTRRRKS